ncbi:MAG: hypothetical protein ACE5E5_16680, partial [Phycisphaerae bacterium]
VLGTVDGRDVSVDGTKLDGIESGANNYTHPNHSGDVTSTGDGATVIGANKVTLAMMAQMATDSFLGRDTAATGNVEVLSAATARTILNVENGSTADQSDAEIETAYNNQVSVVSQAEAEAGTSTTRRGWTAQRVKQAIAALESATATIPKWHRTVHIPDPKAADEFTIEGFPEAVTITKVRAEIQGGTSVTFNLKQRAEGSYLTSVGETKVWTSDKVVSANASYTTFDDATVPADSILVYDAVAVSGAVNDLVLLISGTYD